ncbi:MAG TPA: diacylglycerol kinase family protein [Clostridiaceae bacterium]
MVSQNTNKQPMRVKLIFNPIAGSNDESPVQLMDVIKEMQAWKLIPEPYLIEPDCDLTEVVKDAIADGIRMIVVCGGDGTVSSVARAMIGKKATFGIIPAGTRNNVALSLGIPTDIPQAIAILRKGRRIKVDIGISTCEDISTPFIELCSVGLFSTLFSAGDDIQHGNIARLGDFLTSLTTTPPSEIHLLLEDKQEIQKLGHIVLVSNMPFVGLNYQVGSPDSYNDGLLDVLFFADLSKLDLMGYVIKGPGTSKQEDSRIQHFRVRKVIINTNPAMPIMADGISIGEGSVRIEVRKHALTIMAGTSPNELNESGESLEK